MPFSLRKVLLDANPMKSTSIPVQNPSGSLYLAGISAAAAGLKGCSRPSALSVIMDGRPIPYNTLACGLLRSARIRFTASPAESRSMVNFAAERFSNPATRAALVGSGGPIYKVNFLAGCAKREDAPKLAAAPIMPLVKFRRRICFMTVPLKVRHLYMFRDKCSCLAAILTRSPKLSSVSVVQLGRDLKEATSSTE